VEDGVDHFEVVKVSPSRYCAFTATPLEKYEAYRQVQEDWSHEEGEREGPEFQPLFYGIVDAILAFLGVDKYTWCLAEEGICLELLVDGYPEVYEPDRAAEVAAILQGMTTDRVQDMEERLELRGCCYVPEHNAVFFDHFNVAEGSWEAARYAYMALSGRLRADPPVVPEPDAAQLFYEDVLRVAIGAIGSKVAHPAQNLMEKSILGPAGKPPGRRRTEREKRMAAFVKAHARFLRDCREGDTIPARLLRGMRVKGRARALRSKELGLRLAQGMWDAYREGRIRRRDILDLYTDPLWSRDSALRRYLDLARKTGAF
jgi:hypothetical protein